MEASLYVLFFSYKYSDVIRIRLSTIKEENLKMVGRITPPPTRYLQPNLQNL